VVSLPAVRALPPADLPALVQLMTIDLNKYRVLAIGIVDDRASDESLGERVEAYVRMYVLQDRADSQIFGAYRFKYADGRKNWYRTKSTVAADNTESTIRNAMQEVFSQVYPSFALIWYYPPDDGGDPMGFIDWCVKEGLGKIVEVDEK